MGLVYSFHVASNLTPQTLMRIFLLRLGLPGDPEDDCGVSAPHFEAEVGPEHEGLSLEIAKEQLGFTPDSYFFFKTWGNVSIEGKEEIVRGTLAICQAVTGDAILLFNGEIVLYKRTAGTLYVNSTYWEGDYSLFTPPYEIKAFPVL